ncbi:hypothetical protein, partial [Pseudomonas amygdali]
MIAIATKSHPVCVIAVQGPTPKHACARMQMLRRAHFFTALTGVQNQKTQGNPEKDFLIWQNLRAPIAELFDDESN